MSPVRVRRYNSSRTSWQYVYTVSRGPLRGRSYKTLTGYENALAKHYGYGSAKERDSASKDLQGTERDAPNDKRWNRYMQLYVDNYGAPSKQDRADFNRMFHQGVRERWSRSKNGALAKLLDRIGVRPLARYGKWAVGDTP